MKNLLGISLILLLHAIALPAQTDNSWLTAEFDEICQAKFPADGPGGAVLVAKGDQILYHKAFGLDDVENKKPLQTGMVFRIGSVTKQFTAIAILQLVEKGKLSLQDEITKFIPDYPVRGKKITVEHLLHHTSGIKSYTSMAEWTPEVWKKDFTPAGLVDFFKNQPMDFDPGTQNSYSNSGYILLGYIIEKVSGQTYAEYLEKNVFTRAGLTNTFYENQKRPIPNWAAGYQRGTNGYEPAMPLSMTQPYAAGSLASTVEDLFRWTRAVHSGKLVAADLLKKAHTPNILPDGINTHYGYGWIMGNILGSPTIEHDGGINGFLSSLIYLPNEKITVAILTNCDCNSPGGTATELAALAAGHPLVLEEIDISAAKLAEYEGIYENRLKQRRIITVENGILTSNRVGGRITKLSPIGKDKFRITDALINVTFLRDEKSGQVNAVSLNTRSELDDRWVKTTGNIPEPPKEEVRLNEAQLDRLVGEYHVAPTFSITISREGTQLYGQGTGQPRFEMYPASEYKFFLKVVDAKIEFFPDADGAVGKMVLYQNGQEIPGQRR
ncbi:MAG: serine hydrolase [Lewinellaceae bacterium]|nr:serine hydrolase [Lewinellaceae bacterium]